MKIDRVWSCCSKTAEENAIKLHASPNSRTIFTSSKYHELLELDLRMLLYFFPRKFNIWSFFPTLCNYAIFSLIMRSDAARGQLCEIAPAHNIRSPAYSSPRAKNGENWAATFKQIESTNVTMHMKTHLKSGARTKKARGVRGEVLEEKAISSSAYPLTPLTFFVLAPLFARSLIPRGSILNNVLCTNALFIRKQWTEVAFKIVQQFEHGPQLFVFHTSLDILLHWMAMLFRCTTVLVPSSPVVLYFKSSQIHFKKWQNSSKWTRFSAQTELIYFTIVLKPMMH